MSDQLAYLTTEEVAARFRTVDSTVRYWRMLEPPYGPRGVKVGRRVLYAATEVERFERDELGVAPPPQPPAPALPPAPLPPPTDPQGYFGYRMRELRNAAGLSQVEFAARLAEAMGRSVDSTMVVRTEKSQRPIKLVEAVQIASVLGVPLTDMLPVEELNWEEALRHPVCACPQPLEDCPGCTMGRCYACEPMGSTACDKTN